MIYVLLLVNDVVVVVVVFQATDIHCNEHVVIKIFCHLSQVVVFSFALRKKWFTSVFVV